MALEPSLYIWLVVSTPLKKYEFVNGKDDIPYMKWTKFQMFETTNQIGFFLKLEVATPVSSKTNNMAEHRAASTPYLWRERSSHCKNFSIIEFYHS